MDQTPPVVRPVIMASATWIARPGDAVPTAANSDDWHEDHGRDAEDYKGRTEYQSPHAVTSSGSAQGAPRELTDISDLWRSGELVLDRPANGLVDWLLLPSPAGLAGARTRRPAITRGDALQDPL
jgi:hypothetical protein